MRFEFATATRIIFGPGSLTEAGTLAQEFGRNVLLVTGRDATRAARLEGILAKQGVKSVNCSIGGEPDIQMVTDAVSLARKSSSEVVIAFGGGSALDAGKAVAALLTNAGDVLDYLEIIGKGHPLAQASAPFIAIPTTAGTGSEVTRNAVLASPNHKIKVSMRSALMLPRIALVDPELTYDLPPALTASTGLDALTQLIEPYVCSRANPMTDALCIEGIGRAARSLREAFDQGHNIEAREDLALASLFGGLALANAGLGAVHGFAGPIGGRFAAPHGAVCGALLPHVMAANLSAMRQREPGHRALWRYGKVACLLTSRPQAAPEEGVEWMRRLVTELGIKPLRTYGIARSDVFALVDDATRSSSMKANPIVLTREELTGILEAAL